MYSSGKVGSTRRVERIDGPGSVISHITLHSPDMWTPRTFPRPPPSERASVTNRSDLHTRDECPIRLCPILYIIPMVVLYRLHVSALSHSYRLCLDTPTHSIPLQLTHTTTTTITPQKHPQHIRRNPRHIIIIILPPQRHIPTDTPHRKHRPSARRLMKSHI